MPTYSADLLAVRGQLEGVYRATWQEIVDLQRSTAERMVTNPGLWRQRDRLAEMRRQVERSLGGADAAAREWVTRELPQFYEAGAGAAANTLGGQFGWTQPHTDAVVLLARDTFDDLLAATTHVREDVKRFIRDISKSRSEVGAVAGRTARQTAREVERLMRQHGIAAVVYKNGARVGLDTYSQMVIRTKTAVAYNAGTINQGAVAGVRFYEIFDGPDCGLVDHYDSELANGMIVDADQAATYVIAHPNCARSFGPRPDITDKGRAKKAEPTAGGQATARPEAAQFPLEAAARTGAARQAATARRAASGLAGRPRTPQAVLARRQGMFQQTLRAWEKHRGNATRRATAARQRGVGGSGDEVARLRAKLTDPAQRGHIDELVRQGNRDAALRDLRLMVKENPAELTGRPGLFWKDLVEDTGARHVPVRDFKLGAGSGAEYHVGEGYAFRVKGRSYMVERNFALSPADDLARARGLVSEAEKALIDYIPAKALEHQQGVAFLMRGNPADPYWAKKYGIPDFKSAATGGDGGTYVWGGRSAHSTTLRHEFGHNLDFGASRGHTNAFSSRPDWRQAMTADADRQLARGYSANWDLKSHDGLRRLTPSNRQGLTGYGQQDIVEDYAEAVRLYLYDRKHGRMADLRNGRFRDLFPDRYRLLRQQLG